MTGRARERRRREVTGKIGEGTVGGGSGWGHRCVGQPKKKEEWARPKSDLNF
jgi:hypothetical protein